MITQLAIAGLIALAQQPNEAVPVPLSYALEICRTAFFIDKDRGMQMFHALPEEHKHRVAEICRAYKQAFDEGRLSAAK